jgi:hypothetical protein
MTASRTCRACGAELSPDVRWCLQCYEPVRELTPRPPQLPTIHLVRPDDRPRTSRWRAGPTTFGPIGRLAITALVVLLGPWSLLKGLSGLGLWSLLGYSVLAVAVLKDVWRRERVLDPGSLGHGPRARLTARFPRLGAPIPPIVVLGLVGAIAVGALVAFWAAADDVVRFYLVAALVVGGVGVALVLWNEL